MIRPFCWHQNLVPCGLSAPVPGLYTCIKSWRKLFKVRLQRHFLKLATNEWSDKTFLLTSKLCPLGAVCPCPGAVYMYKIMNKLYKIRLRFAASAFRKLPSVYVFSYFPFGFEGRMWDLIVSVHDHCLSFYFSKRFFWNLQQMTEVTRCSCWHQNFVPKRLSAPAPGL